MRDSRQGSRPPGICPSCGGPMAVKTYAEGQHCHCDDCGHNEFWHIGGAESDPQVWKDGFQ